MDLMQPEERAWTRHPISGNGIAIARTTTSPHIITLIDNPSHPRSTDDELEIVAVLSPTVSQGKSSAVLLLTENNARVMVNGFPPLSVTVLDDRSEIAIGSELVVYDEHGVCEITIYNSGEPLGQEEKANQHESCALCKRTLIDLDAIRRCNHCGRAFHEGVTSYGDLGEIFCASYDRCCAGCGVPWAEMTWTPEVDVDV